MGVLRSPTGKLVEVPDDERASYIAAGFKPAEVGAVGAQTIAARKEADYSAPINKAYTGVTSVLSGATAGATDVLAKAAGGGEGLRRSREANPGIDLAGQVVGGLLPISPGSLASARILKGGRETTALGKIARAGEAGLAEGAITGAGSAVSELALSDDPLTVERALTTLSSRTLFGAGVGGAAGSLAKTAEIGLLKGKKAIDDFAARQSTAANVGDDLANLDAKGLAAAERAEKEAIEAARVPQRQQLADEIADFRRELKQSKQFLLTKDVDLPAVGDKLGAKELGKIALKANKQLDNILDNPVGVAKNPAKALDALQRQENALAKLYDRADDLRQAFAADTSGARLQALETVGPALERNRALQAKIADLAGDASSPKLTQIAEAKLALQSGGGKSIAEQMAGSTAFGMAAGATAAIPVIGPMLAPFAGMKAANLVSEKVFGRLGAAMGERSARAAKAVGSIFEKGARAMPHVAPVATRVLQQVAFAPDRGEERPKGQPLRALYKERTQELRELVTAGPDGKAVVKPHVRERIAETLKPIGAVSPMLADKMETLAAARLAFLYDKMPKKPEIGGLPVGPDNWEPSEMQMRTWARYVAAAEDPDGILERVAAGQVSPEDAEVMRTLYPEQLNQFTMQVLAKLPELRQTLRYDRRIALSILTGVPVDPSMEPRILQALQAQYAVEDQPPKAQAQFGSVKNTEVGTPSQRREQGAM